MNSPSVAIIVLNWNGWRDTISCLTSISKLDYSAHHTFVIDNGSEDESLEKLFAYDPLIEIMETGANLGFAGGCNVGIQKALNEEFTYIWLLNNDAVVDPSALSEMVGVAESDEQIGAVGSTLYHMEKPDRIQVWGGGRVSFWTGRSQHLFAPGPLDYLTGASLLLRCEALYDTGLLDQNSYFMYWEDADLCYRLSQRDWRLAVAPKSVVWHKESASTGKGSYTLDFLSSRSAVSFFRNHYPLWVWPVYIGTFARIVKCALSCNWLRIRAIYRGTRCGLKKGKQRSRGRANFEAY